LPFGNKFQIPNSKFLIVSPLFLFSPPFFIGLPSHLSFSELGKGTFGLVLEAWDRLERKYVALKIVRAIKKYTDSAKVEIDILTKIQRSFEDSIKDPVAEEILDLSSGEDEDKRAKKQAKKELRKDVPLQYVISSPPSLPLFPAPFLSPLPLSSLPHPL
jgi:hypothetical protein